MVLIPVLCASAEDAGAPVVNVENAWFTPQLITNSDPMCESLQADAKDQFFSGAAWDVPYGEAKSYFTGMMRLPRPFEGRVESSPTMQAVEGDPRQVKLLEADGSVFYLFFRTNSGCGGACETVTVLASERPFPSPAMRASEADYASTPAAPTWIPYRLTKGDHYVIGVVDGHLQIYRTAPKNSLHLACDIAVEPDKLRETRDSAIQAALTTIDAFRDSVNGLTRGAGNCGSMGTAYRWKAEVQRELYLALYRPWALRPWPEDQKSTSENSGGDYNRIREQLKTWSLGGVLEHHAYVAYVEQLGRATNELAQFYFARFGWPRDQARKLAERALTTVVANGMGFYLYEPYSGPVEANLRMALLEKLSLSAVRAVPLEGIPLSQVLDSAVIYPEALRYLLEKGADPNWTNEFGKTALMYAAQYNQLESASVLIARGADPNAATVLPSDNCGYTVSTTGMTPLHYATRYASADLINLLLKSGALTFSQSSRGYPLDWLREYGSPTATERNANLTEADVAALSDRLKVPDQRVLQKVSGDLMRRAERYYAAGRLEQAYQTISGALRADADNVAALVDYQLMALRTHRSGPALKTGRTLLEKGLSQPMQANVWFNNGLACEGQRFISYDGAYYCSGDSYRPFLKSWRLAPTAARANKLRELFESVKKTTCIATEGVVGKEQYQFEFTQLSDEGRNEQVQRVYVFHPRSRVIGPNEVHWTIQLADSGKPVPTLVVPKPVDRYDLGDIVVTLLESPYLAQGFVTVGDQICRPYQ
jgi:hypothetical protein